RRGRGGLPGRAGQQPPALCGYRAWKDAADRIQRNGGGQGAEPPGGNSACAADRRLSRRNAAATAPGSGSKGNRDARRKARIVFDQFDIGFKAPASGKLKDALQKEGG